MVKAKKQSEIKELFNLQADISLEAKDALQDIKKNFGIQKSKAVDLAIIKYYKQLLRTRL